jgi:hypothetical protein
MGPKAMKGMYTTQARHSCEGDSYDTGPPLLRRGFIRHRPATPAKGIHTTQARHSCEGDSYDTGPPLLRRGFIRHRPTTPVKGMYTTQAHHSCEGRTHCCALHIPVSEDRKPGPDLNMTGRRLPYICSRYGNPARPTVQH